MVLLDSKKQSHPVKPHLSIREENDVITHVVNVEFSSWERGLDERRLSLVIDEAGVVGRGRGGPSPLLLRPPWGLRARPTNRLA